MAQVLRAREETDRLYQRTAGLRAAQKAKVVFLLGFIEKFCQPGSKNVFFLQLIPHRVRRIQVRLTKGAGSLRM